MGSFGVAHWIIFGLIAYAVYATIRSGRKGKSVHCMTCGTDGPAAVRTRGSIAIEIILWLCFLIPGVIYSIWRLTTRREVCSACGAENIVPPDSPAAVNHKRVLGTAQG